jgi:hypothetical protein
MTAGDDAEFTQETYQRTPVGEGVAGRVARSIVVAR